MSLFKNLRKKTAVLASVFSLIYVSYGNSQTISYEGIVANVNGDIITALDLSDRVNLAIFSAGGNVNPDFIDKISQEVLREMITERIKWKCCRKYFPKQDLVSKEEVMEYFENLAGQHHMSAQEFENFLKNNGISKDLLLAQIKVNLSWMEYIKARYGKYASISDSELSRIMQDIKDRTDQEAYFVYKMFFPVNNSNQEKEVAARAQNIYNLLIQGTSFASLAQNFSKSPNAGKGGELGWIYKQQVSSEEYKALSEMRPGQYKIVRNPHGYVLLYLRDKRAAGLSSFTNIKFVQVMVPFGEANTEDSIKHITDFAMDMKKESASCSEFIKKAQESGFMAVSDSNEAILESIEPSYRDILIGIPAGGISNPIRTENGLIFFCVLNRQSEKIKAPTEDDIRTQKINERFEVFSERELRELKQSGDITLYGKYKGLTIL